MQFPERWRSLRAEDRFVASLAAVFFARRPLVAAQSGFGFHQGWNEGYYALAADRGL